MVCDIYWMYNLECRHYLSVKNSRINCKYSWMNYSDPLLCPIFTNCMIEVLEPHLRKTQNNLIVISSERGFQLGHSSGAVFSIWRLQCMSRYNILSTTDVSTMLNWNSCFSFLSEWVTLNCILATYPLAEVPVAKRKLEYRENSSTTRNAERRCSNHIWVINIFLPPRCYLY